MSTQIAVVGTTQDEARALADILRERDKYARRGDVELLGALLFAYCPQGTIDFRQSGPMVGRLTDGPQAGQYVFFEKWKGLPDLVTSTSEPCDQCGVPCPQCKATGKHHCTALRCGGAGEVITSWEPCPECEDRGKRQRGCNTCGGRGEVPFEKYPCTVCKGTREETCTGCHGTGQMPTGKADRNPQGNPEGPCCPTCQGGRYKLKTGPQNAEPYMLGKLEGYTVLGPLTGFALATLPGNEHPSSFMCEADYDGNHPVILLEDPKAAESRMYLFGGRVRQVQ